jgi:hypothetical protein
MKKFLLIALLFCFSQIKAQSCLPYKITSSANGYNYGNFSSIQQSALSYNVDLNTVLFTAPVSPYWHYANKKNNDVQVSWYNLTTQLWDSAIIFRDSSNNKLASFCGGAIYNPVGNTSLANSFFTTTGPWQDNAGIWKGVFYNSLKPQHQYIAGNDSNLHTVNNLPFGSTVFLNADIQQAGNKIIVAGILNNPNNQTKSTLRGGAIAKADFSSGKAIWTTDTIIPPFYNSATKGYMASDFRLAFAPDGLTGYAVFIGYAAHNNPDSGYCFTNQFSSMIPVVYKTTNGGQTWAFAPVQGWDEHFECLKNISTASPYNYYTLFYSPYGAEHGIDLTVDVNGVLHLVSVVGSAPYHGQYPDSLMSLPYNKQWDYVNYHPIIWDFTTNGTQWQTMMVDSIMSAPTGINPTVDTTATYGKWKSNNGNYFGQSAHIQVSRSVDGKVIFYSWADSDPNVAGTIFNNTPDILMKGFDVTKGKTTHTKNITNGLGTCFFYCAANIAAGTYNSGNWQIPLTWQNGQVKDAAGVYDGTKPVDYYYMPCTPFASVDFIIQAAINSPNTIICEGIEQFANNNQVKIYPNPAQKKITIETNTNEKQTLQIFDVAGNLVLTQTINGKTTIDAGNLSEGVYYINISGIRGTVNKRLVIVK